MILPNLLRLIAVDKSEKILDIACGQGFFSREISLLGAEVCGVDRGEELIEIARSKSSNKIDYKISDADKLPYKDNQFDKAIIILALQNIKELDKIKLKE